MTNYEESAKAYENDYRFAPVGMAVGSFWSGALCAGLMAFFMSCCLAKGAGPFPTIIHNGQRAVFADDTKGLFIGLGIAVVLLVVSVLLGIVGHAAVNKKANLKALWNISLVGVPALTLVGTFIAILVFR